MAGDSIPLLEMRGIVKQYGSVAANAGIDLTVSAGSVVGLLGENGSGKSTLMKILFGMVRADSGTMIFKGRELSGHSPRAAIGAGIGMIHQHFMLVEAMTITENVILSLGPAGRRLRKREVSRLVRETSERYGLDLDPFAVVGNLSLGRRQRVEIVKALMRGAELLILDEPTSNLSPPEVDRLLSVIRRLRAEGKAIIFISHKLGEVLEICDQIVVLRDGSVVGHSESDACTRVGLASLMVGRELDEVFERSTASPGLKLLELHNVSVPAAPGGSGLSDITFSVRSGEILAIAGIDGNGQLELAETIAGLRPAKVGTIELAGTDITNTGVADRIATGLSYIPADRIGTSLVPSMTIGENLMLRDSHRAPFSVHGWLNSSALDDNAHGAISAFGIRAPSPNISTKRLSGGNQQKIVVARELARAPKVLIAVQATWGLDPGATQFILDRLLRLRNDGAAIVYISSELEEVLALGDRIGVMFDGRIAGIMSRADADVTRIGMMMGGLETQSSVEEIRA
ncbi:MAG: transporter ATP-binding protein [Rhodospirillales bacterium]|nr:transporter ATP-binding protein [Rhodospirillales bacterium]